MNIRQKIITFLSVVSMLMAFPLGVSAVNDTATEKSTPNITATEQTTELPTEIFTEQPTKTKTAYSFSENTLGNANLTASQEVITENSQYQFIAVRTRSGDIFYVIIDRLKTEDNVYFLNEVDTYDINLLLSNNENIPSEFAESVSATENPTISATENTPVTTQNQNSSSDTLLLFGVIGVAGIIGFVLVRYRDKVFGKSDKQKQDTITDDEFYEDDNEINEDEE